jgi:hypothetical protein
VSRSAPDVMIRRCREHELAAVAPQVLVLYCWTTSASTAPPEGCAALRIVLVTVPRVSRSCEHFPNGCEVNSTSNTFPMSLPQSRRTINARFRAMRLR